MVDSSIADITDRFVSSLSKKSECDVEKESKEYYKKILDMPTPWKNLDLFETLWTTESLLVFDLKRKYFKEVFEHLNPKELQERKVACQFDIAKLQENPTALQKASLLVVLEQSTMILEVIDELLTDKKSFLF
ncbi:MAG: hypothetical protein LBU68_01325 [Rickettsiales bacterium]|jgi:hypothetical protein|nr:hypothetical protein [Rickettsiales bacterium]